MRYRFETHLESKSREISFAHDSCISLPIVWKLYTEHGSITTVLYTQFQTDLTNKKECYELPRFRENWVQMSFGQMPTIAQHPRFHYIDVIMRTMASQITSLTIIYSIVYSGPDQRKHQSSASLAFVRGIHRWPVNSLTQKASNAENVPFDDVVMWCVSEGYPILLSKIHFKLGNTDFLTWDLVGWRLCCLPMWCQVWRFLLPNMDIVTW